jgi:Uma2 family endonuclease
MATVDRRLSEPEPAGSYFDEEGYPWLENGETMDQKTFHERYQKTPAGFKAELIGGIVYVMASPVGSFHAQNDSDTIGWLVYYRSATPGTAVQNNATTILGDKSEPQPDSAMLIRPEYGGQTRGGGSGGKYTIGAPELVVEVAHSSRSIDLRAKFADYERARVREYIGLDLRKKAVLWSRLVDGHFVPIPVDADGLMRSNVFPGLWLDPVALASGDIANVFAALNLGLASPEHAAFVAELARKGPAAS